MSEVAGVWRRRVEEECTGEAVRGAVVQGGVSAVFVCTGVEEDRGGAGVGLR